MRLPSAVMGRYFASFVPHAGNQNAQCKLLEGHHFHWCNFFLYNFCMYSIVELSCA